MKIQLCADTGVKSLAELDIRLRWREIGAKRSKQTNTRTTVDISLRAPSMFGQGSRTLTKALGTKTNGDKHTDARTSSKRAQASWSVDHELGQEGVENNLVATGAKPNIGTTNAEGVLGGFPSVASWRLL